MLPLNPQLSLRKASISRHRNVAGISEQGFPRAPQSNCAGPALPAAQGRAVGASEPAFNQKSSFSTKGSRGELDRQTDTAGLKGAVVPSPDLSSTWSVLEAGTGVGTLSLEQIEQIEQIEQWHGNTPSHG